ncbi:MAG: nuclear transport factor 2 family protein [Burkholderiales bacterium]|nr:nuclear transport factor 2 family protein [Burkholderiales bacterium]
MTCSDAFQAYLQAYARKDLPAIESMLSSDVRLCDWNKAVAGRAAVLAETAKNFAAAEIIEIETLATYARGDGVAGELRIVVDGQTELRVVDVLRFDTSGKITDIRAYLGCSDAD